MDRRGSKLKRYLLLALGVALLLSGCGDHQVKSDHPHKDYGIFTRAALRKALPGTSVRVHETTYRPKFASCMLLDSATDAVLVTASIWPRGAEGEADLRRQVNEAINDTPNILKAPGLSQFDYARVERGTDGYTAAIVTSAAYVHIIYNPVHNDSWADVQRTIAALATDASTNLADVLAKASVSPSGND